MKKIRNKNKRKFLTITWNINSKEPTLTDVVPYLINCYNKRKEPFKDKKELQDWLFSTCRYQYWARCEYEILIGSWPFGSRKMINDLRALDIKNENSTKIANTITQDMEKIDVFYQICANFELLTDLFEKLINE